MSANTGKNGAAALGVGQHGSVGVGGFQLGYPLGREAFVHVAGAVPQHHFAACDGTFIAAPPTDSTCGCNECAYMKLNTLAKLRDCLRDGKPEIQVEAS